MKKVKENSVGLTLKRNIFNNYEHSETHFVFDRETKEVFGKQNYETESVDDLTEEDIEICQKMNFKYRLPLTHRFLIRIVVNFFYRYYLPNIRGEIFRLYTG